MNMELHPLVQCVAKDLAEHRGADLDSCVSDAMQALRSVANWVDALHRSAQADLMRDDLYVTTAYLRGIVDGTDSREY